MIVLPALARLAAPTETVAPTPACELCGAPLADNHGHVVEIGVRGVHCTCRPCAILFVRDDSAARFRTVPSRVLADPMFALTAARWAALGVPVGLAFFFRDSSQARTVGCYPGPAGLIDATLEAAVWDEIAAATPLAAKLADDVEALLVRAERGAARPVCYLVPISTAYELAARLRRSWRGMTGGDEANRELAEFFAELERRRGRS